MKITASEAIRLMLAKGLPLEHALIALEVFEEAVSRAKTSAERMREKRSRDRTVTQSDDLSSQPPLADVNGLPPRGDDVTKVTGVTNVRHSDETPSQVTKSDETPSHPRARGEENILSEENKQEVERKKDTTFGVDVTGSDETPSHRARKGERLMPEGFVPKASTYALALAKYGLDEAAVADKVQAMWEWSRGKGARRLDWDLVLLGIIRRDAERAGRGRGALNGGPPRGPDLHTRRQDAVDELRDRVNSIIDRTGGYEPPRRPS